MFLSAEKGYRGESCASVRSGRTRAQGVGFYRDDRKSRKTETALPRATAGEGRTSVTGRAAECSL